MDPFKTVVTVKKGMNNLTEMYSAVQAEVPLESDIRTGKNEELMAHLKKARKVVVCGQALSHCVNYTTRDVLDNWAPRDPSDIVVLSDCQINFSNQKNRILFIKMPIMNYLIGASPVTGFEVAATKFLEDMIAAGVTVSSSTDF